MYKIGCIWRKILILIYVIKVMESFTLSDLQQILAVACYLLKSYKQKNFEKLKMIFFYHIKSKFSALKYFTIIHAKWVPLQLPFYLGAHNFPHDATSTPPCLKKRCSDFPWEARSVCMEKTIMLLGGGKSLHTRESIPINENGLKWIEIFFYPNAYFK